MVGSSVGLLIDVEVGAEGGVEGGLEVDSKEGSDEVDPSSGAVVVLETEGFTENSTYGEEEIVGIDGLGTG